MTPARPMIVSCEPERLRRGWAKADAKLELVSNQ